MLYLFTGNDHYTLRQETQKWKSGFLEKHGDFWLTHIKDIRDIDINFLSETLFSQGLFWGIKLTILELDISPKFTEEELFENDEEVLQKNTAVWQELLSYLETHASSIPEEHRVLIVYFSPDKRTSFYKNLKAAAKECKVFESSRDPEILLGLLHKRYNTLVSTEALRKIIEYKGAKIEKIIPELEKLCISYSLVEKKHIEQHIVPEFEESVFALWNAVLSQNKKQVFSLIETILLTANIYLLYHSLLSNLRVQMYILLLEKKGYHSNAIKDILKLGNRGFLADKKYNLPTKNLKILYERLCEIDTRMKQGKLLGSEASDFRYEMEKIFIEILS
jgi:DNA polymerase III delta subunit